MAGFGWAYVNCTGSGGGNASGPTDSVQVHTGGGDTGGTSYFMYHSNSYGAYPAHSVILSGTLVVEGAISASEYHIENVVEMDVSGSTFFGNSADDAHIRTGSFVVYDAVNPLPIFGVNTSTAQTRMAGLATRYENISVSPYTSSISSCVIGVTSATFTYVRLHSAVAAGAGAILVVKDQTGSRSSPGNVIRVQGSGSETIDGLAEKDIDAGHASLNLYSDGSNWFVF